MTASRIALKKWLRPLRPLVRRTQDRLMTAKQTLLQPLQHLPVSSARFGPPKGFYRETRAWFEQAGGESAHFQAIAPARDFTRSLVPKTIHASVYAGFTALQKGQQPELFTASIPQGRFWGYYGGCILSPDDRVLADVSPDVWGIERHAAFRRLRLPRLVEMAGTTAVITTPEAEATYGHWLLEALPRFELLREALGSWTGIDRFVVSGTSTDGALRLRQEETLARLGIAPERIVRSHPGLHLRAERLVFPSFTTRHLFEITPDIVRRVRAAVVPEATTSPRGRRRLYASRGPATFRRITNESEVLAALRLRGFEQIALQGTTLREQAALFHEAEAIVGVVSSGLSNAVFSAPGTKLVEIFPDNFWVPFEWALCDAADLDFYYLFASGQQPLPTADHHARYADCQVNVPALHALLDLAGL